MADTLHETKSLEEAIYEIVAKFQTANGKSMEPVDALTLTAEIIRGMGVYVTSLTHEDFLNFARTLAQQGYVYAVGSKYPLDIQQALAKAHDALTPLPKGAPPRV